MEKSAAGNENLRIEPCEDTALLSGLFLELAEDERSDVQRTQKQAFEEMTSFLSRGEKAYIFTAGGNIAGYALAVTNRKPYYLHHFYICRGERRKGYGTIAFKLLLETLNVYEMDLDVYVWNERGRAFWESLGFKPRAVIMRYQP
jgi:GNAT superfamily N-acetyltransferase